MLWILPIASNKIEEIRFGRIDKYETHKDAARQLMQLQRRIITSVVFRNAERIESSRGMASPKKIKQGCGVRIEDNAGQAETI
jgi:hypothetical protein